MLTRVFDAPRELLFEALSSPEHVRHWWGPRGTSLPVCEMDFRVGGKWRNVCLEADGQEYGFRGEYREIDPPARLVQTFEFEGMPGEISVETMTLEDLGSQTRITVVSRFASKEARDGMLQSGMEQGARETYERLAEYLAALK
jgi:uncharacterized protein YndB with AHSA1/START domain